MKNWQITPTDKTASASIQGRIDNKTKPPGALGQLEALALQLALIQQQERLEVSRPVVLVFAGDHGVAAEGISIAPSEVTTQMVANFLAGGAAINCFCRVNDVELSVIDAGIKLPLPTDTPLLVNQSVGNGTENLAKQSAMTAEQLEQCLSLGADIAQHQIDKGSNVLSFGEMGIGNTTSAAAILAALTGASVSQCVGRGTGITDEQLNKKTELVEQALSRFDERDPYSVLQQVGGFEIAQICGAMLRCAEQKITIVVDGFIVSAAAMLAHRINENALDYMVFAHCSHESGHQLMLETLKVESLLDLGLRLGEGTGGALALPLIRAAACFYNDMATFESAGVTV